MTGRKRLLMVAVIGIGVVLGVSAAVTGGFSVARDSEASAGALIVDETVQAPELLEKVQPAYPTELRAERAEGKVVLQAIIDEAGRVADVEVLRSSEREAFDTAASDAVRQWRYKPALKEGSPVKVRFTIVVRFSLERDQPGDEGEKKAVPEPA